MKVVRTTGKSRTPRSKLPNARQPWVDAVNFVLSEILRFDQLLHEALKNRNLNSLPGTELLHEVEGSNGRKYVCGRAAQIVLRDAAEHALQRSKFSQTVGLEPVLKALKRRIVDRFITKGDAVELSSVDSVFTSALNEAAKTRANSRHLIPCQLMFQAEPDSFSIGPVTFHNRVTFRSLADELLTGFRTQEVGQRAPTLSEMVLEYYGSFSWVADVAIKECDQQIGAERAMQAVSAAVDFMHLLFGHYHSRRMIVGGPRLDTDVRATFEIHDGEASLSYSIGSISAVGFPDGWASMLMDSEAQRLVAAAGRAIEAITDPSINRPLGLRFIDAASWHGQAVRETSAAASIVKSVTALERLVTTKKSSEATRIVTERSAAMSYSPDGKDTFTDLVSKMEDIYDLRSRLTHGMLSPFDVEVRKRRYEVLATAEQALINGLALFDQDGLFDRALSRSELTEGLERLVSWSRSVDAQKAAHI